MMSGQQGKRVDQVPTDSLPNVANCILGLFEFMIGQGFSAHKTAWLVVFDQNYWSGC